MPTPLETPRLLLREVTLDDAAWYLRHFSDPEVVRGSGDAAPAGLEGARVELQTYFVDLEAKGYGFRWGIERREAPGELVGSAGFYAWRHEPMEQAMIGYDLAPAWWGRGYMTEALAAILEYGRTVVRLERVEATVLTTNERSPRVLGRLGFRHAGILREHGTDEHGVLRDEHLFVLGLRPPDLPEGSG